MNERKRVNIKAILVDPVLQKEIMEGATDFICKVEGIKPHSLSPAAQAVDRAIADRIQLLGEIAPSRQVAAAALRSAANDWQIDAEYIYGVEYIRTTTLEKIASELEAHQ